MFIKSIPLIDPIQMLPIQLVPSQLVPIQLVPTHLNAPCLFSHLDAGGQVGQERKLLLVEVGACLCGISIYQ